MTELATTYVRIRPRSTGFKREADTQIKRATPADVEVQVSADTRPADERLTVLKDRLDQLRLRTTDTRVRLDGDARALTQLARIDAEMIRLDRKRANPQIDLEGVARAEAQLGALNLQLDKLDAKSAGIGGGRGGIIDRLASAGHGGFFGGLGLLGVGGGAAAVPLGIGAAGLGASFLTPAVAGTTGLGLFGAASAATFKRVGKVEDKLDDLNKRIAATSPTTSTTTTAATAAQIQAGRLRVQAAQQRLAAAQVSPSLNPAAITSARAGLLSAETSLAGLEGRGGTTTKRNAEYDKLVKQRKELLNSLSPAERRAAEGLDRLEKTWVRFEKAIEPQSFRLLATGTDLFAKGLHLVEPLTKAVGDEVDDLAKRADHALDQPFWRHFFTDFLAREAPRAVDSLGTSIGNVVTGIAHLSEDWAPLGHSLERDLVHITQRFEDWTKGDGPGGFIELVRRDGPVVADAIGAVAHGLGGIARGLEPIGRIELQALTPVLNLIGDLGEQHPEVLTALGVAYLSIAGGMKAMAAVKGITGAVNAVRTLGGLRGGGGLAGGGGGILGKASRLEPVPVYVTNWHGVPGGGGIPKKAERAAEAGGIGAAIKRVAPKAALALGERAGPIAALAIAISLTPEHATLTDAQRRTALQNPQIRAEYAKQLNAYQLAHPEQPITPGPEHDKLLAKAIRNVADAARDATAPVGRATFEISALNKVMAANPQQARNILQTNDIVTRSFDRLADSGYRAGRGIGHDLGRGLVDGIRARIPHATLAGKILVEQTAKQMRLAAESDSPSKVTMRLGRDLGDGLAIGIGQSEARAQAAAVQLVQSIADKIKVAASRETQLRAGITASLLGNAGLGGVAGATDSLGNPIAPTVTGVIGGLTDQRAALRTLRHQLHREHRRGLSTRAEREIAELGLDEGGALAASLDDATKKQLRHISRLLAQVHGAARGIGSDVAQDVYGPRIEHLLQRLVHVEESAGSKLDNVTIHKIGHQIAQALRHAHIEVSVEELDRVEGHRVLAS